MNLLDFSCIFHFLLFAIVWFSISIFPLAQVILRYLYFNESIREAVQAPRIHHQLIPMRLEYEPGLTDGLVQELQKIGHEMFLAPADGFVAVTAIGREHDKLVPVFDPRRLGSFSLF